MKKIYILLFITIINSISSFTIHNPVIWSDVPDIDMIRVGDTYYMISTTMFFKSWCPNYEVQRFSFLGNL